VVVEESVELLPDPLTGETLRRHGVRGLHPGCGGVFLEGALNSDRAARTDGDDVTTTPGRLARVNERFFYLEHDSTEPLPLEDEVFDWVFSEAFIEHITPAAAIGWLREMRRLLKPGGFVRLSTPDLRKYVEGYLDPEGTFYEVHRDKLDDVTTKMFERRAGREGIELLRKEYFAGDNVAPPRRAFIINQIFRFWGHRWIYDLDELRHAAVEAGFDADAVEQRQFREGRDPKIARYDDQRHFDESIYIEIVKT
jgi:SAM-dependent methyltransferase